MSLPDFVRVLKERWLVVVLCLVLGATATAAVTLSADDEYEATAVLFVSARAVPNDPSSAYDATMVAQQRIASYAELATDARVTGPAAARVGNGMTPTTVANGVEASFQPETVLLSITATADTAASSAAIANAVADELIGVVAQLERSPDGLVPAPVTMQLVRPASPSSDPVGPLRLLNVLLGALVGLVVGLVAALVRDRFDNTVKSESQLREVLDVPVLGAVPRDPDTSLHPITTLEGGATPRSESFRKIRTSFRFVDVDAPVRVVMVTSPLAGEGKTVTACNLASVLGESGGRIVVVEADLRRPSFSKYLSVEGSIGLTNALSGSMNLEQVIQSRAGRRFDVVAAGAPPPNPSELLATRRMAEIIRELRSRYDVVVIDTPPILPVADAATLAPTTDGAIIVARSAVTRSRALLQAADSLRGVSATLLGAILVDVPLRSSDIGHYLSKPPGRFAKHFDRSGSASGPPALSTPRGADDAVALPSPRPTPRPRTLTSLSIRQPGANGHGV